MFLVLIFNDRTPAFHNRFKWLAKVSTFMFNKVVKLSFYSLCKQITFGQILRVNILNLVLCITRAAPILKLPICNSFIMLYVMNIAYKCLTGIRYHM